MFYNFVQISRLPFIIRSSYSSVNRNRHIVITSLNRLYGKDAGSGPPKKVNICVTSRKNPYDICDPGKKRPCVPSPPPYNVGPRKCPDPNKMNLFPKPNCPWDKENECRENKYNKHLIIGILSLAIAIGAVWYFTDLTKHPTVEEKKFRRPKPTCRIPKSSKSIPTHVPYLLVGGGTASFSAFRAIKSNDPTAKVLVVSNECYLPYMRPPLSKEMWFNNTDKNVENLIFKQWNGTERSIYYEPQDFYTDCKTLLKSPKGGVSVILGYKVDKIDVVERKAYLDDGTGIEYDKCLIATGGTPRNLSIFENSKDEIQERVTLYRDIFDFEELHELSRSMKSIAIIGGGFLGSELACAFGRLAQEKDLTVYQIYKEEGNMGKILPEYLSQWTTNKMRNERVNTIPKTKVEDVSINKHKQLILHLNNGNKLTVDHVVVALGIKPNTDLAKTSDLEVDPDLDGFLVNAEMEARSNLYIAGDCSCFYDIKLGRRRVEHHDHAVVTGRLAGENMTGAMKPYVHQSMFWSDLGPNIGYEAIGLVDSRLPTVAVFAKGSAKDTPSAVVQATDNNLRSDTEEQGNINQLKVDQLTIQPEETSSHTILEGENSFGKGVVFYLRDDIVVGIVLWNVFNRMSIARQVLKEEKKYDDLNEVAKLFNIHEGSSSQ